MIFPCARKRRGDASLLRLSAILALWLSFLAEPGIVVAQAPDGLSYRQVFVPEDELDGQVRGLLPMRREEFERRLAQANTAADPLAGHAVVRVEEAVYRARLEGDELLAGTAELQIALTSDLPVLTALAPCSLTLQSAWWEGEVDRPAVLGVDPQGTLQCLVEQEGALNLAWSLRGDRSLSDTPTFDIRLPPAPHTRLEIETPGDVELSVDRGIVSVTPQDSGEKRRWSIDLGGLAQVRLEARRSTLRAPDQPLVVARPAAHYTVVGSAIDLEANFVLDVLRRPLKELRLAVEKPLEVTGVRMGDEALAWSVLPPARDQEAAIIVIVLPEATIGVGRAVQVTATGSWPVQPRWTLPRLRIANAIVQEGEVVVSAARWLRLQARPLEGCLPTDVAINGTEAGLDQFRFKVYADDAGVEIGADRGDEALIETSGTHIQIEATQVTGVMIAELASRGGEAFSVEARVPRHWIVDSVESQPAELLADRSIVPRGKAGAGQQRLRLALRRPLSDERPLRLVIRGHFRRPAEPHLLTDDFYRLAVFPAARAARRLVSVRVTDPAVRLEPTGITGATILDPQALTEAELRLFETPPSSLLFEARRADEGLNAALVEAAARYSADVALQAVAGPGGVQQSVNIVCRPESSALQTLLLQVAPVPPGPILWSLAGEDPRELEAELLSSSEGGDTDGEGVLYRLKLQRPRTSEIQIRGQWTLAPAPTRQIALVWLPEAVTQRAAVEVHAVNAAPLAIRASEMPPLPVIADPSRPLTTLRARYRYDAGRRATLLVGTPAEHAILPAAWIESLHVVSRFAAGGHADHEAALQIENTGLNQISLRLPTDAVDVRLVETSGERGTTLRRGTNGELLVPLSRTTRQTEIRLRYASQGQPSVWRPVRRLRAPLPESELPILARSWTVSLSPRLATLEGASRLSDSAAVERDGDAAFAGWATREIELPVGPYATLDVYRPAVIRAWALCLALVAVAASLRAPVRWSILLSGVSALTAMVAPLPLAWLLGSTAAGAALGMLPALLRPRTGDASASMYRSPPWRATAVAAPPAAIAVLAWLAASSTAWGAPGDEPAAETRARAVIPVDEEQHPTGDYVFLSPKLYEALHRLADKLSVAMPSWLLESARYELPATVQRDGPDPTVPEIKAQFEFHTFQRAATIRLPLKRSQVLLLEGRARLDGRPIAPQWQDDAAMLTFSVESPGRHVLELSFGAGATRVDDGARLVLDIPPAARATVHFPAEAAAVNVGTSAGAAQRAAGDDGIVFLVGQSQQLDVRWLLAEAGEPASMVEGDQLLWWTARPGSMFLEGRFRLRPVGGVVRKASLTVDPRLRLAPGTAVPLVGRVSVDERSPHVLNVEFAEPSATEVELRLSWLWPGAAGAGNLVLPQVELHADRMVRQWMAISMDPALRLSGGVHSRVSIDPAQFVQEWGAAATTALTMLSDGSDAPPSPLVVRPVGTVPEVDERINWSVSARQATADYTAQIRHVPPHRFEYRLAIAPQVKVTAVELVQRGRPAAIRWSQHEDGTLWVSLMESPAEDQALNVRAELLVPPQRARFALPNMRLHDVSLLSSTTRIYRRADVLVELERSAGWISQEETDTGLRREGLGRLVASLARAGGNSPPPVIGRRANPSRFTGTMLIHAGENDGDWRAGVDLALEVSEGVIDELRLAIPEHWTGSPTIDPPLEHEWIATPGTSGRQLVIRPPQAIADKLELSLRGSLNSGGANIRVPDVNVIGDAAIEREVLLDAQAGSEPVIWETTGLQAIDPATSSLSAGWDPNSGDWFRVIGSRFEAQARPRHAARGQARIYLTDVHLRVRSGYRAAGRATFVLRPASEQALLLSMPPGMRLVQILLNGVAAQATQTGLRTWEVTAGAEHLPLQAVVIYEGRLAVELSGPARFVAPHWSGIESGPVCWTIEDEPGRVWRTAGSLDRATREALEFERLDAIVRALNDVAAGSAADLPPDTRAAVYRAWKRAFDSAAARLRNAAHATGPSEATARLEAAEEAAVAAGERLLQAGVSLGDEPEHVLNPDPNGEGKDALFVLTNQPTLSLTPPSVARPTGNRALLLVTVAGVAGLSLAAWPITGRLSLPRRFIGYGPFLLAVAGLAWWLLIPLGSAAWLNWLGWLLVAAGVWLAWHWPWRRATHEPGSTIRRLRLQ